MNKWWDVGAVIDAIVGTVIIAAFIVWTGLLLGS